MVSIKGISAITFKLHELLKCSNNIKSVRFTFFCTTSYFLMNDYITEHFKNYRLQIAKG